MENQRHFLTIGLLAISAILYFKWIEYSGEQQALQQNPAVQQVAASDVPSAPEVSSTQQNTQTTNVSATDVPAIPTAQPASDPASIITVETDMVIAKINTLGGTIERLELKEEPVSLDQPDVGFPLLKNNPAEIFVTQDGLASNISSPNHTTQYSADATQYSLGDGQDAVEIPLRWTSEDGIEFTKTITFSRDSYIVDIDYSVNNASDKTWNGGIYARFSRSEPEDSGGGFGRLPSYTGAAIYTEEDKYKKYSFDDLADLQDEVTNGKRGLNLSVDKAWIGMLQHYFVGAWIPESKSMVIQSSVSKGDKTVYRIGYKDSLATSIAPGTVGTFKTRAYLGSKNQARLKALQKEGVDGLTKSVDYGMLTPIADPLFTVLSWLHKLVNNWGWAIILLTILLKLLFYPLSAASYRSMGKMRKLQPRLKTLKERYKDDRQKFQMEMMALYKKEKVNPAGGCLPILIQIPVFIALYWVLLESVEMRQAPFALWWQDLSAPDPTYILPIAMGVSMFLMQKLNPAPMDDIQKKVFMIMPFALTFLFLTFPQGLVLYWVVNNILTMAQQWFNYKQQENA